MSRYVEYKKKWYNQQKLLAGNVCTSCSKSIGINSKSGLCGSCSAKRRAKKSPLPYRKGKQKHLFGEGNPRWRGGVTKLRHKVRASQKYKEWRKSIFEKDDYTCQKCLKRGVYIEADHFPIPFINYIKKFTTYEEVMSCDKIWKMEGRTLCRPCHDKTKNKFYGNQYTQ